MRTHLTADQDPIMMAAAAAPQLLLRIAGAILRAGLTWAVNLSSYLKEAEIWQFEESDEVNDFWSIVIVYTLFGIMMTVLLGMPAGIAFGLVAGLVAALEVLLAFDSAWVALLILVTAAAATAIGIFGLDWVTDGHGFGVLPIPSLIGVPVSAFFAAVAILGVCPENLELALEISDFETTGDDSPHIRRA